jgi:hypothetical protein
MNTKTIIEFFNKDNIANKNFLGAFARDQLPKHLEWPSSLIVNTDPIKESGEHWLALFINKDGVCEFFDPLGFSPKYHKFENYIKQNSSKYFYNDQRIQSLFSKNCGYFCCLFLLKKSRNYNFSRFLNIFFRKSYLLNDKLIEKMKKNNFFK